MPGSLLVSSARTPIGKLSGSLSSLSAADLGGIAVAAALSRAGIDPALVDQVVLGHVLQAGQGQNPARQAAVKAGVPMDVPAVTVNMVCLSGIHAIYLADQMIRSGDADIVVAGGMESMTQAPHLLPGSRRGFRLGDVTLVDSMISDGLWCSFDGVHMGAGTESYAKQASISRAAQDEVAVRSHERAATAVKEGRFADEIVPVPVPQKGEPLIFDTDEGVRPGTSLESLGRLKPAFAPDGTITAGNASQISDGAAAVVLVSRAKAAELGLTPLAELAGFGIVAGPDPSLLTQPSRAITRALDRAGLAVTDVDLF
jgi:acetyl-CoA C-acetyltransferase